jgi:tetratricopeptide (TPR) repeat protein
MEGVGRSVDDLAAAVDDMERGIGLRLDAQTEVLREQSTVLREIHGAILTPARTRAAERVADAAQLLARHRWERALAVAEEGIEADPNNPGVFSAAGWALLGMDRMDDARLMFEEARDAADGDERSQAARQAARAALAGGKPELAYTLARDARAMAESAAEQAAVDYDFGVYALLNGDAQTAGASLEAACRYSSEYCKMALLDRHLDGAPELRDQMARILTELSREVQLAGVQTRERVARVRAAWPPHPNTHRAHGQIGRRFRPPENCADCWTRVAQQFTEVQRAVAASAEAPSLQESLRSLARANTALAEVDAGVAQLGEAVARHERAARQHEELEEELTATDREIAKSTQVKGVRKLAPWLMGGGVIVLFIEPAWGATFLALAIIAALVGAQGDRNLRLQQAKAADIRQNYLAL